MIRPRGGQEQTCVLDSSRGQDTSSRVDNGGKVRLGKKKNEAGEACKDKIMHSLESCRELGLYSECTESHWGIRIRGATQQWTF